MIGVHAIVYMTMIDKTPPCNDMCPDHSCPVPLIYLFSDTLKIVHSPYSYFILSLNTDLQSWEKAKGIILLSVVKELIQAVIFIFHRYFLIGS